MVRVRCYTAHRTPCAASVPMQRTIDLDALVIGGGIAGLWAAQALRARGHVVAVVEQDALGAGQTLAAQGIVHAGMKYALKGQRTAAADAVAAMPARWRAALAGEGDVDLRDARRLAEHCWLWADSTLAGYFAQLFAPHLLQDRAEPVARAHWPAFLTDSAFDGFVLRLDEPVLDMHSVVTALAAQLQGLVIREPEVAGRLVRSDAGVGLDLGDTLLRARRLVLCAGAGNAALLSAIGADGPRMQLRPLHQVCAELPLGHDVFGHCLSGQRSTEPPITITTHGLADPEASLEPAGQVRRLYLGGALASRGVERDPIAQIDEARHLLARALPGVEIDAAHFSTLRVDRAEPEMPARRRPDDAFLAQDGAVLTAWPTKMTLAPALADRIVAAVGAASDDGPARTDALREALRDRDAPDVAAPFWTRTG